MRTLNEILADIRARAEKATPGQLQDTAHAEQCYWIAVGRQSAAGDLMKCFGAEAEKYADIIRHMPGYDIRNKGITEDVHRSNYDLHSHARQDIPALLRVIEKLVEQRDVWIKQYCEVVSEPRAPHPDAIPSYVEEDNAELARAALGKKETEE